MQHLILVHSSIYAYEKAIIDELLDKDAPDYAFYIVPGNRDAIRSNALIRFIDKRFLTSKVAATEIYDFSTLQKEREALNVLTDLEGGQFGYIINLTEPDLPQLHKLKFDKILKPLIDRNTWFTAAVRGTAYTTIQLQGQDQNLESAKATALSFRTLKGIYNNRDKALYYFAYLVSGCLHQTAYPIVLSGRPRHSIASLCIYYMILFLQIIWRRLQALLYTYNWKIALIDKKEVTLLNQPRNTFWADPFIIEEDHKKWIFFEELDKKKDLGHISVVSVDADHSVQSYRKVLQQPFHLSFPNVFKLDDAYYMLPEQSSSGQLVVYKANNFPYDWSAVQILMEKMQIIDPVWIFYEGRYWIFGNKIEAHEYENNERLYIYYADDLFSKDWKPHKKNPVLIDIPRARNAGQFFSINGEIFRPSQNCGDTYGSEITINKVLTLTTDEYEEEAVGDLNEYNRYYGMHTINEAGGLKVTDFLFRE